MKQETLADALKVIKDTVLEGFPTNKWCIAGGAACYYLTAGDVDVWVFAKDDDEFANLCGHLHNKFCNKEGGKDWAWSCNYGDLSYEGAFTSHNTILGFKTKKLGELSVAGISKRVQIMVTQAPSVYDLINAFDISCHSIAWQWDTLFPLCTIGIKYQSPYMHRPKIINMTDSETCQARLKKFIERYEPLWGMNWPLTEEDEPIKLNSTIKLEPSTTPIKLEWSFTPSMYKVYYATAPNYYDEKTEGGIK